MIEPNSPQLFGMFLTLIQSAAFMAALVVILLGSARIISLVVERNIKKQTGSIFLDRRVESATGFLTFGCLNRILTAFWLGVLQLFVMQHKLTVSFAILVDVVGVAFVVVVPLGTAALVRQSLRRRRERLESESDIQISLQGEDQIERQSMNYGQERSGPMDGTSEECPICGERLERAEDRCPLCFARRE